MPTRRTWTGINPGRSAGGWRNVQLRREMLSERGRTTAGGGPRRGERAESGTDREAGARAGVTDRSVVDVLRLPIGPRLDLAAAATGQRVVVRAAVALSLLHEALLDERVEVRVQSAMVDLLLVVVLEFLLDREPVGLVEAGDHVEQVTLKTRKVVHTTDSVYQS